MALSTNKVGKVFVHFVRNYSAETTKHYKVVVAGGGSGGLSIGARACRQFGVGNVAIIEPAKVHYYQPMWTLVGAGVKTLSQSGVPTQEALPRGCKHYNQYLQEFDPERNTVTLKNGEKLSYDYLVVALGIQIDLKKVEGLEEALKNDKNVCTNYLREYVEKTFPAIQDFRGGNAIFTFPNTPIKCAGAPQKIMYLAEDYWKKHGVKDKTKILYNTALGVIFGVPRYAESLMKYDFLHVGPPQSGPDVLKNSSVPIVDATGFLDVDKNTCQHVKFPNIFGIGDCTNIPAAKTAAAVAACSGHLWRGIKDMEAGKKPSGTFGFDGQIYETFPLDQSKERRTMYHLKRDVMPQIYWHMFLKGYWNGPGTYRKIMHLGMCC
ncbi:SQOR-like protein [Mya arenaria]|uniref:SQOR-like protein n=1 Tax=Mya arenaria TaxID=6604 RepID=A0ABY7FBA0_MYAAR|nr:SQOR-like protein [Mya arenaria]